MNEELEKHRVEGPIKQELEQRLELLKGEVDALQIAVTGARNPGTET